jgi:hypothetical protein
MYYVIVSIPIVRFGDIILATIDASNVIMSPKMSLQLFAHVPMLLRMIAFLTLSSVVGPIVADRCNPIELQLSLRLKRML